MSDIAYECTRYKTYLDGIYNHADHHIYKDDDVIKTCDITYSTGSDYVCVANIDASVFSSGTPKTAYNNTMNMYCDFSFDSLGPYDLKTWVNYTFTSSGVTYIIDPAATSGWAPLEVRYVSSDSSYHAFMTDVRSHQVIDTYGFSSSGANNAHINRVYYEDDTGLIHYVEVDWDFNYSSTGDHPAGYTYANGFAMNVKLPEYASAAWIYSDNITYDVTGYLKTNPTRENKRINIPKDSTSLSYTGDFSSSKFTKICNGWSISASPSTITMRTETNRKVYTPTEEDMVPLTKKNLANVSELISVMRTLDRQPVEQTQRVSPTDLVLTDHTNNYKYWLQKAWDELILYLGYDPGCHHNLINLSSYITNYVR